MVFQDEWSEVRKQGTKSKNRARKRAKKSEHLSELFLSQNWAIWEAKKRVLFLYSFAFLRSSLELASYGGGLAETESKGQGTGRFWPRIAGSKVMKASSRHPAGITGLRRWWTGI
jgi:hypothetical protein